MPSVAAFLRHLEMSRLVESATMERIRLRFGSSLKDDANDCARVLAREGVITPYQAKKLLTGHTQGFFLGQFRILRRLGEGGMGKVYLAVRERDGQRFALKVLPPSKAQEDEHTLKRFRREMELSRRVMHPNVALTVEVGVEGAAHFMVVEYVPGDTLYHVVKRTHGGSGPMRVPDAARYFLQAIDGLEAAHDAGVIHRDIKPSNLMVTPEGGAKVLDLGLARMAGEDKNPLTHANAVVGTLDYASPEQLGNAARADRRSDLYSLGCTLYFALTGQPPFEGGDIVNKIFRHRMEEPEPIEKLAPGVPQAFGAIVRKLMAKEPAERYQTCAELRRDLARWTDPDRVRALSGAVGETARAFRPPPPSLEEDDLRMMDESTSNFTLANLKELGSGEVSNAPLYKPAPPPRSAVVVPNAPAASRTEPAKPASVEVVHSMSNPDMRWVVQFSVAAVILGIVAIALITWLRW
jgi:eukaryotic-like serine/threonine-protein kinase